MNGSNVALDTSVAIAVLNDAEGAGDWVRNFRQIYLPVPVIGELIFGALNSQRPQENMARVQQLIDLCTILEAKATTASVYAQIRMQLKQKGKPIPENEKSTASLWRSANVIAMCH